MGNQRIGQDYSRDLLRKVALACRRFGGVIWQVLYIVNVKNVEQTLQPENQQMFARNAAALSGNIHTLKLPESFMMSIVNYLPLADCLLSITNGSGKIKTD